MELSYAFSFKFLSIGKVYGRINYNKIYLIIFFHIYVLIILKTVLVFLYEEMIVMVVMEIFTAILLLCTFSIEGEV